MSKLQQKLVDFATQKGQAEAYTKQAQRAEQDARAVAEKSPSGQIDALTIENKQLSMDAAESRRVSDQYQREAHTLAAEVLELRRAAAIPQSPSMVQYQGLAVQVQGIEQRAEARETELRRVMEESRQNSKVQMARLHALHQEEVEEKEQQIKTFRRELDNLLGIIQALSVRHPAIAESLKAR